MREREREVGVTFSNCKLGFTISTLSSSVWYDILKILVFKGFFFFTQPKR